MRQRLLALTLINPNPNSYEPAGSHRNSTCEKRTRARSFNLCCCFNNFPAGKKVMKYAGYPVVDLTVAGETLRFEQDNGSMHVGTSVWPSSLVLVKWVEHILLKGGAGGAGGSASSSVVCEDIQPRTFSGKRGVDLGTGCGVAGLGLALLGLNVVLTDIAPVMPALKRNFKKNVSSTSLASAGKPGSKAGKVKIAQLYWENEKQIAALKPPFDYVIAADVVYLENIVEPLLNAMSALAGPHTVILLGYQIRQAEAHELFWRLCPDFFHIQQIPHTELHPDYAWDENDIYILKKKKISIVHHSINDPEDEEEMKGFWSGQEGRAVYYTISA